MYLYPTPDELSAFLATSSGATGRPHYRDLSGYRALIDAVRNAEHLSPQERLLLDTERKIFSNVLGHTRFASTALAAEVEHFKYFLHALRGVDLRKPMAFIRAADEEMAKLDQRKKTEADRLLRLRQLSATRKRDLQRLQQRREALGAELISIARYVRDNLLRIEDVCRTSLVVQTDISLAEQIEQRLVEDLKAHFRHQLKTDRFHRAVTPEYLDALKRDVATLGREIIAFRKEAALALEKLYRSVFRHVGDIAREIDAVLARLGERRGEGDATDQRLFERIEQQLISLVTGYHLENGMPERHTATPHVDVFNEKKREALVSLFELVRGERRAFTNRRSRKERRTRHVALAGNVDRRIGRDRRRGMDRRAVLPAPAHG
jgi:hypothetical protein